MSHKNRLSTTQPSTASFPTIPFQRFPPAPSQSPPQTTLPSKRRGWWRMLLGTFLLMFTTAVFGTIAGLTLYVYNSERLLPGVQLLGVPLGLQTTAEAQQTLLEHWSQQTVTLQSDDMVWIVSAVELGIHLDVAATIQNAYEQGRTIDSLQQLWQQNGRMHTPIVWQIETSQTELWLQSVAEELAIPPMDATLIIHNGQAEAIPAQLGRRLDIEATQTALTQNVDTTIQSGQLPLVWQALTPQITDVSVTVDQANQMLAHPLTIQAYDPIRDETVVWEIAPNTWSQWLTVQAGHINAFSWAVDINQLASYFDAQSEALGALRYIPTQQAATAVTQALTDESYAADLRIFHHAQTHTVQAGETLGSIGRNYGIPYPWLQQANPTVGDFLAVGQTIIIPSPDALIPLPVVKDKRIVVSIADQTVWVYQDGEVKWQWTASTGIASSPTAPGIFQIQTREANAYAGNWNLWMPSFLGIYRPVPTSDFMNGFHGFPTRNNTTLLWTGDLGHPVTYGCVLLSSENAQKLFEWAEEGVIVEIKA